MENALVPRYLSALRRGKFEIAIPGPRRLQQVAVLDIAAFGVLVIEERDRFLGERVDIASDELTGLEAAEILSRVIGHKIGFYSVPLEHVRAVSEELAKMFEWFDRVGYDVDIGKLREDYPEVPWHTYEDWARNQDWDALKVGTAR